MRDDCPDCQAYRRERATQLRTGTGDLGDLLTRVAMHESAAHGTSRLSTSPIRQTLKESK